MERGRSRKARSGCLGRIFGFVLFLIVAAVGVIAAVKYMPSRERADLDALYAAGQRRCWNSMTTGRES